MVSKVKLLSMLPPFKGDYKLIVYKQTTNNIVDEICESHSEFESDYDLISQQFNIRAGAYGISQYIWEFLKYNFTYKAESEQKQTAQSPAGILQPGFKVDCKHYSLFAGGIIDSLLANGRWDDVPDNAQVDWFYRFAGYDSKHIEHVFVVVTVGKYDKKEIWIDPVLNYFDLHEQPVFYKDVKPMALYRVSGVPNKNQLINMALPSGSDRDKQIASFLTMVNLNLFKLKDLLKSDMQTVYGPVQNYFGDDYSRSFKILLNILNG